MSPRKLRSQSMGTPAFVKPFLHTLNQMREREHLRPEQMTDRAQALLNDRFGITSEVVEAAFAHGSLGLMAEHTHYFDGFALMLSLPYGTAVALRRTDGDGTRIAFEGAGDNAEGPDVAPGAEAVIRRLIHDIDTGEGGLDVAVVSTVPLHLVSGRLGAAAVATMRALAALDALSQPTDALLDAAGEAVDNAIGSTFSRAYLHAAAVTEQASFVLVDTRTRERIGLELASVDRPGWALVEIAGVNHDFKRRKERHRLAVDVLKQLQAEAFPRLTTLRELEHRDLDRATAAVPRRLRPALQYLVTENGRVQKLVAAVRRRDWQMFGALLLMSHAAKRTDWRVEDARADFVVDMVEEMSLEGLYGAVQLGEEGGAIFVVGQPFSVPPFLDKLRPMVSDRFGIEPETTLL